MAGARDACMPFENRDLPSVDALPNDIPRMRQRVLPDEPSFHYIFCRLHLGTQGKRAGYRYALGRCVRLGVRDAVSKPVTKYTIIMPKPKTYMGENSR